MTLPQGFSLEHFDTARASDAELIERFQLEDLLLHEYDPDAEALPHQRRLQLVRKGAAREATSLRVWVIRAPDRCLVAVAWLGVRERDSTGTACSMLIGVHPGYRRRGLARALLRELAGYANEQGFEMIESVWGGVDWSTLGRLVRRRHAIAGDGHRISLATISWPLLRHWIDEGRRLAPGATIETYHDDLPVAVHEHFLPVWRHLQSHEPLSSLRAQLPALAADWQAQARSRQTGRERWLSLAMREPDRQVSGLIEAIYNPAAPKVILVRVSGILAGYEGRGSRKWLHAELLFRVRALFPRVEHIGYRNPPAKNRRTPIFAGAPDARFPQFRTSELLKRLN